MQQPGLIVAITPLMAQHLHEWLDAPKEGEVQEFRVLLKKCYRVCLGGEPSSPVSFTEEEIWMIQPVAKIGMTIGSERTGQAWFDIVSRAALYFSSLDDERLDGDVEGVEPDLNAAIAKMNAYFERE